MIALFDIVSGSSRIGSNATLVLGWVKILSKMTPLGFNSDMVLMKRKE